MTTKTGVRRYITDNPDLISIHAETGQRNKKRSAFIIPDGGYYEKDKIDVPFHCNVRTSICRYSIRRQR
jgi:hypothetical protein